MTITAVTQSGEYLNFGIGADGGGSQDRPLAKSFAKAQATARAGGEGNIGFVGTGWPRRCRIGDPTQS